MVLTNYWLLILWMIPCGILLPIIFPTVPTLVNGKMQTRTNLITSIITFFPYFLWAGMRDNTIGDTWAYRQTFFHAPSAINALPYLWQTTTKDKGFSVLMVLIKSVFGNSDLIFFLLIAAFQSICLIVIYRKYSSDYWASIFLFIVSTDYLSWMHNGMRQFIAVAGAFACFGFMLKKKYPTYIILILLLSTIHASVLLMIPIVFIVQGKAWNNRTLFFIACTVGAISFINQFTPLFTDLITTTQYADIVTNEIWANDDGTSALRVLVYSIPAILSLIGKRFVDEADDPVINVSVNMSIIAAGIYALSMVTSGIYVGRIPIYFSLYSYISLPWLIRRMFTPVSARFVYLAMILGYLCFFYYQLHITWGIL